MDDDYTDRSYDNTTDYTDLDDWDGQLYDRGGNRVNLSIQTPADMLPPVAGPGDFATIRRRSRF